MLRGVAQSLHMVIQRLNKVSQSKRLYKDCTELHKVVPDFTRLQKVAHDKVLDTLFMKVQRQRTLG